MCCSSTAYRSGEAVHDLAWLRLGDFYRHHLKDEKRALAAYLHVCNRTTWAPWGTPPKPVSTGAGETLVKATTAASEILRKQGKLDEVRKLQFNLHKAQAEAAAGLLEEAETIARFRELLALPAALSPEVDACAKRIEGLPGAGRAKVLANLAGMATDLSADARDVLVTAAAGPDAETAGTALRALLVFVPPEKTDELLTGAREQDAAP